MTKRRECRECGQPFQVNAAAPHGMFCGAPCRKTFNNRRQVRGAELYDLFRAVRRERADAKAMSLWTAVCRLEEKWQEEDDRERPGRRSYAPPAEALTKLVDAGRISRRQTPAEEEAVRDRARARTRAHYEEATA